MQGDRTDKKGFSSFNTWKDIIIPGNVGTKNHIAKVSPLALSQRKYVANYLGRAQEKKGRLQLIELAKRFPSEVIFLSFTSTSYNEDELTHYWLQVWRTFLEIECSVGLCAVRLSRAGFSRASETGTHRLLQAPKKCEVLPRPSWRILVDPPLLRSLLCGIILIPEACFGNDCRWLTLTMELYFCMSSFYTESNVCCRNVFR